MRKLILSFVLIAALLPAACGSPVAPPQPPVPSNADRAFLDTLQQRTFNFFWERANPANGLIPDRWPTPSFSSVAAVGFGLAAYPVGVEHNWVTRAQAASRVLTTLRYFWNAPQGPAAAGTIGYHGFFYHFLDMQSGTRFETVELSTIDTALLLAGVLVCREYFSGSDPAETEIRSLADSLYQRVDWQFMVHNPGRISMGWKPESGYIDADWRGYNEGMILLLLALGSPTHSVDTSAWSTWTSTYVWGTYYGQSFVNFPPLFGHQYSHIFVDFRGIQDDYMRGRGIDYFENSRRATLSQRSYAIDNPMKWVGYGADVWGLTASDGPVDAQLTVNGTVRKFMTYAARGAAFDYVSDDGTLAPTAAGGSVPFAPEYAIRALRVMRERYGEGLWGQYGFFDAFNPTFTFSTAVHHGHVLGSLGWFDTDYLGIDEGPIVLMIENYKSELIWKAMRKDPYLIQGLKRAGFTGGWLSSVSQ